MSGMRLDEFIETSKIPYVNLECLASLKKALLFMLGLLLLRLLIRRSSISALASTLRRLAAFSP
jgi:hypothetical protein